MLDPYTNFKKKLSTKLSPRKVRYRLMARCLPKKKNRQTDRHLSRVQTEVTKRSDFQVFLH